MQLGQLAANGDKKMMFEEHSENGRVSEDEEGERGQCDGTHPSRGINSPRHSVTIETAPEEIIEKEGPMMEFFDHKRQDSEGEGVSEGESSPKQRRDKDTDSYNSRAYVMVSPPASPGERRGWWVRGKN